MAPLKAVCRDTWEKETFLRLPLGSRIERGVPVPAPHPAPGLAVTAGAAIGSDLGNILFLSSLI